MFTVTINEKAGQQSKLEFYKNDVTIGRMKGNDIVLPRTNISKIHATLKLRGDHFMVQDHNSTNGTFINGVRINGEAPLGHEDMVYVGEFVFQLEKGVGRGGQAPAPPAPPMGSSANTGGGMQSAQPRQRHDTIFDPYNGKGPDQTGPPGQGIRDTMGASPEDFNALNTGQTHVSGRNYEAKPFVSDALGPQSSQPLAPTLGAQRPTNTSSAGRATITPEPEAGRQEAPKLSAATAPHNPSAPPSSGSPKSFLEDLTRPPMDLQSKVAPGTDAPSEVGAAGRVPEVQKLEGRFDEAFARAQQDVARMLFEEVSLDDLPRDYPPHDESALGRFDQAIDQAILALAPGVDRDLLRDTLQAECTELGALERYLGDETIQDIYVNSATHIVLSRGGTLERAPYGFSSAELLNLVATRLLGASSEEAAAQIRFLDGTRAHVIRPPLTPTGAVITIRKPTRVALTLDELLEQGMLSAPIKEFLEHAIGTQRSILIAGPHSSGKSALLGALALHIPESSRMVVIEDQKTLLLPQAGAVRLEASLPTGHDKRFLLDHALAMNPERIVLDCCSGPEAYDFVTSVAAGTRGNLATLYAIHSQDAVRRLESLCLLGAHDVAPRALREQIAYAMDLVLIVHPGAQGTFRINQISELQGVDLGSIRLQDVFYLKQEGPKEVFLPTGYIPSFYEDLHRQDPSTNLDIFKR